MTSIPTLKETTGTPVEETDADIFVLGDGEVGVAVTRRLEEDGRAVTLIDASRKDSDVPCRQADPADVRVLTEAGLGTASTVIVATPSDSRNLLLAQLVRVRFAVGRILVLANEPDRVEVLADAGHDPICATTVLADAVVDHL